MLGFDLHEALSRPILRVETIDLSMMIRAQQNQIFDRVSFQFAKFWREPGRAIPLATDVGDVSAYAVPLWVR
jgi:hypothetical protein